MGSLQLITRFISLTLLLGVGLSAHAQPGQPGKLTQQAIQRYQAGDLMAARSSILEALQSSKEKNESYTWYVKGFIFKEIYKDIDKGNPNSENREIAIEAILKSFELSPSGREAEENENNRKALKSLAVSYYNDAVLITRSLTPENLKDPEQFYERYKSLITIIEPDHDFIEQDTEFYKNMARGCRLIYDSDPLTNQVYFDLSNQYYIKALDKTPDDFQANYNMAVNYYNHGVHMIRQIDHNTEIFDLIRIQDECVALFKLALPYMRKAHEIKPEHKKTLGGLMAIHRSLSDDEQAELFQAQLEELIKNGIIRE